MIGKAILIFVLIVNIVFASMSVSYVFSNKMPLKHILVPAGMAVALAAGVILTIAGI